MRAFSLFTPLAALHPQNLRKPSATTPSTPASPRGARRVSLPGAYSCTVIFKISRSGTSFELRSPLRSTSLKRFVLASSFKRFLCRADSKDGSRLTSPVSTLSTRRFHWWEPPFFPSVGDIASANGANARRCNAESARIRADRAPRHKLSQIKAHRLNAVPATATECSLRVLILGLWTEPLHACAAGSHSVETSLLHLSPSIPQFSTVDSGGSLVRAHGLPEITPDLFFALQGLV